jgi:hypothetical protein
MSKKGRKVRNWKRRWFVLKGNKLSYFAKETEKTPLGEINIETCILDELKEREESGRVCFINSPRSSSLKLKNFVRYESPNHQIFVFLEFFEMGKIALYGTCSGRTKIVILCGNP